MLIEKPGDKPSKTVKMLRVAFVLLTIAAILLLGAWLGKLVMLYIIT